jgi:hypothetical protein
MLGGITSKTNQKELIIMLEGLTTGFGLSLAFNFIVGSGLIGFGIKKLQDYVESTETQVDDAIFDSIPSVAKATKNGLKRAGFENEEVMQLLTVIRDEVVEQQEMTDGKVVDELNKQVQEIKRTGAGTGNLPKNSKDTK